MMRSEIELSRSDMEVEIVLQPRNKRENASYKMGHVYRSDEPLSPDTPESQPQTQAKAKPIAACSHFLIPKKLLPVS